MGNRGFMRVTILLIAVLLSSFILNSAFALTACGDAKEEFRYRHLDWSKATKYTVDSSIVDIEGLLCIGVDRKTNTLKRLHYRDSTKAKILTTAKQLKKHDIAFLRRSDLTPLARIGTRNIAPLTIKINSERIGATYTEYKISLKFVRNMTRGFTQTDLRDLVINARIYKTGRLEVYYGTNPSVRNIFNAVNMKVGRGFKIDVIGLQYDRKNLGSIKTINLPKAKRN